MTSVHRSAVPSPADITPPGPPAAPEPESSTPEPPEHDDIPPSDNETSSSIADDESMSDFDFEAEFIDNLHRTPTPPPAPAPKAKLRVEHHPVLTGMDVVVICVGFLLTEF